MKPEPPPTYINRTMVKSVGKSGGLVGKCLLKVLAFLSDLFGCTVLILLKRGEG